ncbi:MAG: hypothetical protein LQ343_004933 [Gyalolechia ehrenbergii]|nr:MAG: hypothetical protein LQ343_004933 [Gyalolechia ehrenbergii]
MCLTTHKGQNAKQRPMEEKLVKHHVAVFDPETCDLRRLPLSQIDTSNYEKVQIPKRHRQFDLYASYDYENDSVKVNAPTYAVVARSTDEAKGKSHLARLYYSRLGLASELQRFLSAKHRILYIGTLPPVT